jgi:hypothetical protein
VNGKNGRTAYLQSIVGTIHEDPLELKYAHIPEIGPDGQYALPPGDDPNIIDVEGEWVEEGELNPDSRARRELPR